MTNGFPRELMEHFITDPELLRLVLEDEKKEDRKEENARKLYAELKAGATTTRLSEAQVDITDLIIRLMEANNIWTEADINRSSLFLGSGREEVKAIGQELNERGGFVFMQSVCEFVRDVYPKGASRSLSIAWHGIGDWLD